MTNGYLMVEQETGTSVNIAPPSLVFGDHISLLSLLLLCYSFEYRSNRSESVKGLLQLNRYAVQSHIKRFTGGWDYPVLITDKPTIQATNEDNPTKIWIYKIRLFTLKHAYINDYQQTREFDD